MLKVILHLGFPKSGSSSLQENVFYELEKKNIIKYFGWRKNKKNEKLIFRPSSRLFLKKNILKRYLGFSRKKTNILSDESFTAPTKLRENNFGKNIRNPFEFPKIIKRQIKNKFKNDKINIKAFAVLRNQADLIFSQYVEEYNLKKYKNVDILFKDNALSLEGYEIYNYYKYYKVLIKTFGKKNVKFLFFENLKKKPAFFCNQLSKFTNISFEDIVNLLKKKEINKKRKNKFGYYTKSGKFIKKLTLKQKKLIKSYFKSDNIKLNNIFSKDINFYQNGYL